MNVPGAVINTFTSQVVFLDQEGSTSTNPCLHILILYFLKISIQQILSLQTKDVERNLNSLGVCLDLKC